MIGLSRAMSASAGYLLIDGAPRRPLRASVDLLGERLAQLDQLTPDDRAALIHILDHMLANNRPRCPHRTRQLTRTARSPHRRRGPTATGLRRPAWRAATPARTPPP